MRLHRQRRRERRTVSYSVCARGGVWSGLLALLLTAGCGSMERDRPPIARLHQLAQGEPTSVSVQGKVLRVSPLLSGTAYEIEDDSGTIWVHSQGPPAFVPGEIIQLQGQLWRREIAVEGRDFGETYIDVETAEPQGEAAP